MALRNCTRLAIAATVALSAACGGKSVDHGSVTLVIQGPAGTNPLTETGVVSLSLVIRDSGGVQLAAQIFDVTKPIELDHAPMGPQRIFYLQTLDTNQTVMESGQSNPVDLVEGQHVVVTVQMS